MLKSLPSKKIISCVILFSLMAVNYMAQTYTSGWGGAYTNAPSEGTCLSCHTGSNLQTSGSNWNNLLLDNGFSNGEYIPDTTYVMSLSYKESGKSKFGFELTALDSATSKPIAGTFTITSSSTTQKNTYTVGANTRTCVYHTSGGTSGSNGAISWSFKWKAPSTNIGTIFFYVVVNSTNNNNSDNGDVIYAKKFAFRPSSLLPTAKISATPNPVCIGDTLFAQGTGKNSPTSWKWSFSTTQNMKPTSSSTQDQNFVFSAAGTYKMYLQTTNTKGKSKLDSLSITVSNPPTISIKAASTTICQGDSVTLSATYSGIKILWNTGDTTDKIKVAQAGNYSCVTTNAAGCKNTSNTVSITVVKKPILSLSANTQSALCSNDTFKLTVSPSGLTNYYMIVNGNSVNNGSNNIYNLSYNGSTNLKLAALADSNGCMSDTSNNLSLNFNTKLPAPSVMCDTNTGSSISYKWQSVNGATGYQVSEDSGATWKAPSIGATGLTHIVTNLANNIYMKFWVRATDNAPCNVGDAGSVVCHTGSCTPIGYNTNSYKTSICPGDSSVLDISFTNAGKYAISLDGGTATAKTKYIFKPTQNTSYTIDLFDSAQSLCPKTSFKVDITILPAVTSVTIKSDNNSNSWCVGDNAKFTSPAVTGYTYEFFVNGTSVQKGAQNVYNTSALNNGDKVKVIASNTGGCWASSSDIGVTMVPKPVMKPFEHYDVSMGNSYHFKDTVPGNATYIHNWNFGDGQTGTGVTANHLYAQNGSYTVWMTVSNGNCIDSISQQITVSIGLANIGFDANMRIWPNPFTNELNISWNSDSKPLQMELISMQGSKILSVSQSDICNNSSSTLATESLPSSIYWLKVVMQNGQTVKRIIKL